jgi:hypothetical protein
MQVTPRLLQEVRTAYDMCINAYVVLEMGDVARKEGGTSSGEYLTLDDNCILHILVLMLILQRMAGRRLTLEEILANFKASVLGDDNLGMVHTEEWPWFSWEKFQQGYADLGFKIKYIRHGTNFLEREFLSLKFVEMKGGVIGVPDRVKSMCSLVYGGQFDDPSYRLLRALAFRMYCWGDVLLYRLIDAWCKELHRRYRRHIERETAMFAWSTIRAAWKNESELLVLHTSFESRVRVTRDPVYRFCHCQESLDVCWDDFPRLPGGSFFKGVT